jgi:superfamily II DNA or RNA helicase
MDYVRPTTIKRKDLYADFDKEKFKTISVKRWNPFTDKPIKDITELLFTMRKVVNADPSRFVILEELLEKHRKLIIFYNFNYELDILRKFQDKPYVQVAEYNGHKHEPIPEGEKWVYLVQYISGGEGWNCTETNVIVFYSQNYSYRMMTQAAGRIDRLNTPFATLYYYHILSTSVIDRAIAKALKNKKKFNERTFALALKTDAIIEGE